MFSTTRLSIDCAGGLTVEEIAAQTFVFILAGHETSSSTIAFCLHELALNNRIQQQLLSEIDSAGCSIEHITFDEIQNLEYLDAVIQGKLSNNLFHFNYVIFLFYDEHNE
ncbi:hypothetical protein LSTR_LSTR015901 [Laodelphax striatellus]|uniref:Cytochrome P450 n=1 Tax=Laodelphax striatellus TaxID=195883 RepID=A0A482WM02_LAOST|nr:hypothetical protein LSTR_LSTR015901 [Laodelphax striatellus]